MREIITKYKFSDSELSKKMHLFYNDMSVSKMLGSKNARIFEISIFYDRKINLLNIWLYLQVC